MQPFGVGPAPARIMIVGEYWSPDDERACQPFQGSVGAELGRMLHEAGVMASECYMTNVVNARPGSNDINSWIAAKKKDITPRHVSLDGKWVMPIVQEGVERLWREIELVSPNVILALGNLSLWALTGAWGALKWRGSQLHAQKTIAATPIPLKVIPTIHPRAVLSQWEHRAAAVNDIKRVAKECGSRVYSNQPAWSFLVRPSFHQAYSTLNTLLSRASSSPTPIWIDFDLETRAGHIACAGLSWTLNDAICIPFMCVENKEGYWNIEEEAMLVHKIYKLLTHPNVNVRGQNLLYDAQYTYRHWHFVPRVKQDTMISHHTLFAGLPKRLDYQASLYCEHYIYWKDDGKTWTKELSEDQLWRYNCIDCVRTREVGEVELKSIEEMGLQPVEDFQQSLFWPVLRAMQLGVRIDTKRRAALAMELQDELSRREEFFIEVLGHSLNPRSSPQMSKLFYTDLNIPPIYTRPKKGQPPHLTCDEEALQKIKQKEPILIPLIDVILQYRQIGVFLSTFILMPLDQDQRMRCSYNICGTETYRFSSSQNAFGSGGNLQNLPKGDE
jgi:uracil-DNA glycosylase